MQFLVARLLGGLLTLAASAVGRVLLALSLSFVTYTGFDLAAQNLMDMVKNNMSSLPADVVGLLAWLWVDKAVGLVFSAYTAALAIKMAGSATFTKLVRK